MRAASERACQSFDKVHASAEILRDYSLDLRESGAHIFGELFVAGGLVWEGRISLVPEHRDIRSNTIAPIL